MEGLRLRLWWGRVVRELCLRRYPYSFTNVEEVTPGRVGLYPIPPIVTHQMLRDRPIGSMIARTVNAHSPSLRAASTDVFIYYICDWVGKYSQLDRGENVCHFENERRAFLRSVRYYYLGRGTSRPPPPPPPLPFATTTDIHHYQPSNPSLTLRSL